jgi:hypothetical protein
MKKTDYPPLFVAADAASLWGQRIHRRIIATNLILVVFAAAFAYLSTLGGDTLRVAAAIFSASVLFISLVVRKFHRRLRDGKSWFEGRALSETTKSLTWRYMMRVPPFDDDFQADGSLINALTEISDSGTGVEPIKSIPIDEQQITPYMRAARTLDFAGRLDRYVNERLADQIRWYSQRAAINRQREKFWSNAITLAQIVGVISAVGVIFSSNRWVNAISLCAAIAAAATAWSQLGQHSMLSKSYALAAKELERISDLASGAVTEDELVAAVIHGEGSVSREHTLWTAKRSDKHPPAVRS